MKGDAIVQTMFGSLHPVKAWVDGVEFEDTARKQVAAMASLPFVHSHIAIMPDVHAGIGATVGSVIPMKGAIVPAAVGVDLGCGMVAQRTSLHANDLPDDLGPLRAAIERAVPVGFAKHDRVPASVDTAWSGLAAGLDAILAKHPKIGGQNARHQLGTLGGSNHYIEVVLDEEGSVWVVLHSGSRGVGNRIGTYFIERAKREMQAQGIGLVDRDLAYFTKNSVEFDDYVDAVSWAQDYAKTNRAAMMTRVLDVMRQPAIGLPSFELTERAVNCHHNYVAKEHHFGEDVYVTRKGAVRAGLGEFGIIPGSMGARSYIVRGKGNPDSFESCSHGAGRRLSRTAAKRELTLEDLERQTKGVECRKDAGVLDEAPGAYKNIDKVMAAQRDLVDVVHRLKQALCVKG